MSSIPEHETAESHAQDLLRTVVELVATEYGDKFVHGNYAVVIQATNAPDGLTYTWDWYWKKA